MNKNFVSPGICVVVILLMVVLGCKIELPESKNETSESTKKTKTESKQDSDSERDSSTDYPTSSDSDLPRESSTSPFEGVFEGEFVGNIQETGEEQSGRIILSINSKGEVDGRIENYASGRAANCKGFIKENGQTKLTTNYSGSTATLSGNTSKIGDGNLKGVWSQYINGQKFGVVEFELMPN